MKKYLIAIMIILGLLSIGLGLYLKFNQSNNEEKYINKNDYLYDIAIDYMKNEDIKEYNPDKNKDNYHFFINYDKFGITKKGKYKYAYMWILGEGYYLDNGKQEISNGYSMFFKFTFENDKVIKYELPEDGTLYLDSIRKMCVDENMFNKVSNYELDLSNEQSIKEYYSNNKYKKILKLDRFDDLGNTESKSTTIEYDLGKFDLAEKEEKKYENEKDLSKYINFISTKFNIKLDSNWHYYIHYFDKEASVGHLMFQYYIGEIKTNKYISFFIENGKINEVAYSYLDKEVDEKQLINKLNTFKNDYVQEKKEFINDEEFLNEKVEYVYHYQLNQLVYVYSLFYYEGPEYARVINNEHGTQVIIE